MGMNGLLAVLAILLTGYGLLSDEKRLDLKLRISWVDRTFIGLFIFVILFVVYSPVIVSMELFEPFTWNWGFDEETLIFSCLSSIILFFGWKMSLNKIPSENFLKWAAESEQLLRERKFVELGYLLNKYHAQLFSVVDNQVWHVRIHNYLMPPLVLEYKTDTRIPFYKLCIDAVKSLLAKPFPSVSKKQDVVELSISKMLKSKAFVTHLAETYPLVAAKATCIRFRDSDEFISLFLEALISHPGSPLYRELRDNQNCSHTGEFFLDESNPLLNFYLKDISVAQKVGIWKPIGNYVTEYIKKQSGQDNFYNQSNGRFSDGEERWASPIFIGGMFFEVMVSVAIFQRTKDHMWLMYCDDFVREILESLEHASNVDKHREFPSKFDYLLYELFSSCDHWIGTVEYLDFEGLSVQDISHYPEHWAAKTLGSMLRKIIKSDKLPDTQKGYFLEISVRRMQDLDHKNFSEYSKLIFDNCVRTHEHAAVDNDIVEKLVDVFQKVDNVLKSGKSTFEVELSKLAAAA